MHAGSDWFSVLERVERLGRLGRSSDATPNRSTFLHRGVLIGAFGVVVSICLGLAAALRPSGLAVAPALASSPLHLRAGILLFSASVAFIASVLWARLASTAPAIARLQRQLSWTLALCAITPLLVLGANYVVVTGLLPRHLALIPSLSALATAALYATVVHPLSGITGVGLGARLVLRSSYLWLLGSALMQFVWVTARVFADRPSLLWHAERPTIEVGLIGFAVYGALGLLLTNLHGLYHSRNMTQTLMRTHYVINGLLASWGLIEMWSMRFPGSYQVLLAPVVAIALLIFLAIVAGSSGLLDRRGAAAGEQSVDGARASVLATAVMVLIILLGVLITISATTMAGRSDQPLPGLLGAQVVAVGLAIVPLAVAACVAAMRKRSGPTPASSAVLIAVGAFPAIVLWSLNGIAGRPLSAHAALAELIAGIGVALLALLAHSVTVPDQ